MFVVCCLPFLVLRWNQIADIRFFAGKNIIIKLLLVIDVLNRTFQILNLF